MKRSILVLLVVVISAFICVTVYAEDEIPADTLIIVENMDAQAVLEDAAPVEEIAAETPLTASGIRIEPAQLEIFIGDTSSLKAIVEPDGVDQSVNWSSSNTDAASVVDGVVSGVSAGSAQITAVSVNGGFSAVCDVTVREILISSLAFNFTELTGVPGETLETELNKLTISPENATDRRLKWETADTGLISLDTETSQDKVLIRLIAAGTAEVIVRSEADDAVFTSFRVLIEEPAAEITAENPSMQTPTEESAGEKPAGESVTETSTEEPAAETQAVESTMEVPTEEPAAAMATTEPAAEEQTELPAAATAEPAAEEQTELPATATATVEPVEEITTQTTAPEYGQKSAAQAPVMAAPTVYNADTRQFLLSWTAVSGATGYKLWRSATGAASGYIWSAVIGNTTSTISSVSSSGTYWYKIAAIVNGSLGEISAPQSAVMTASVHTPTLNQPVVTNAARKEFLLTWTNVPGATGYKIWRSSKSSVSGYTWAQTVGTVTRLYTTVPADGTYYFKIAAIVNGVTESISMPVSGVMEVIVPAPIMSRPTIYNAAKRQVRLSWSAVSGASGYKIWRSASSASAGYNWSATVGKVTSTISSVPADGTYYYKIAAIVNGQVGKISMPKYITVVAHPDRPDYDAMMDIRAAFTNASTVLPDWFDTDDYCQWSGIYCDYDEVSMILISLKELQGTLSPSIGKLNKLWCLELNYNQITGEIPVSIGELINLSHIDLCSNQFTGTIPSSFANLSALDSLHLDNNQLSGSIPSWIGDMENLQYLSLGSNQFTGTIPSSFANLSALKSLYLSTNQLSGSIPNWIGNMVNLQCLGLGSNQFTGTIPSSFANLSALEYLYLDNNQLSGSIPNWIGNLKKLKFLYLSNNQFTGGIPSIIGELNNLEYLYINENKISGEIPASIGNLKKIKGFWLNDNQLSGMLPSTIGSLTELTSLYLYNNPLTGSLPTSIASLTKASNVFLWNTDLCIPDSSVQNWYMAMRKRGSDGGYIPSSCSSAVSTVPTLAAPSVYSAVDRKIQLSWSAVEGATGYKIWESATSATKDYDSTQVGNVTTTIITVPKYGTYYFKVAAVFDTQTGLLSAPQSCVISAANTPTMNTPIVSSTADKTFSLSWTAVPDVSGYYLCRATDAAFTSNYWAKVLGNVTSVTDAVSAAGTYYYRVAAIIGGISHEEFSQTKMAVMPAILAPTMNMPVVSDQSTKNFYLSWSAVPEATGYKIWRSSSSAGSGYTWSATLGNVTSVISSVPSIGTYWYKVAAIVDGQSGTISKPEMSVMPALTSAPVLNTPRVYNTTNKKFQLTWSAVPNASGYSIWRSNKSANNGYNSVLTTGNVTLAYNTVPSAGEYYYIVAAIVDGQLGTLSNAKSAVMPEAIPEPIMYAPTVHDAAAKTFKLSWSAVPGAEGYRIWRSATSKTSGYNWSTSVGNTTTAVSVVPANGVYAYKVAAIRDGLIGDISYPKTGLMGPPVTSPEFYTPEVYSQSGLQFRLSWDAVPGATGYRIWRSSISADSGYNWTTNVENETSIITTVPSEGTYYYKIAGMANGQVGPIGSSVSGSMGFTEYRALLIGESDYSAVFVEEIPGAVIDSNQLYNALQRFSYQGQNYDVVKQNNASKAQILSMISSTFADADSNDVSLFFYSGHGRVGSDSVSNLYTVDGGYINAAALRSVMDSIPGKKIIIIDACFSGGLIEKDGQSSSVKEMENGADQTDMDAFNSGFIHQFYSNDESSLEKSGLNTSPYYVMTSASSSQTSEEGFISWTKVGFFSYGLMAGIGWDEAYQAPLADLAADSNKDGIVDFSEAFYYAKSAALKKNSHQTAQCYPVNSKQFFYAK